MKFLHIGLCATGLHSLNGLQKAMIVNSTEYKEINCGIPNLGEEVARLLQDWTPDLCFIQIQRANILKPETAALLKSKCFTVNWTGDIRVPTPQWYFDIGKLINLTLFTNMDDVRNLREKGIATDYLDIGIDPEIYKPEGQALQVPEIVFLANNYHDKFPMGKFRREIVAFMQKEFGPRFGVYGSGWLKCNGSFMGNQMQEAACYRGAKIAINCSNISASRYSSDRILRLMASGTMCLTKWFPDIQEDYRDRQHLVTWDTLEELKKYAEKYLAEEWERKAIATSGMELIHRTKTFDHMIKGLIHLYYANK